MTTVVELFLDTLSVIGLLALGWFLFGRLLVPVGPGPVYAVIPARGGGEGLEQTVRGLLWLRGGELVGARIVVVDLGLDAEGRALAQHLCADAEQVCLCTAEELNEIICT